MGWRRFQGRRGTIRRGAALDEPGKASPIRRGGCIAKRIRRREPGKACDKAPEINSSLDFRQGQKRVFRAESYTRRPRRGTSCPGLTPTAAPRYGREVEVLRLRLYRALPVRLLVGSPGPQSAGRWFEFGPVYTQPAISIGWTVKRSLAHALTPNAFSGQRQTRSGVGVDSPRRWRQHGLTDLGSSTRGAE
jgi:hypothetical protein